jgi:hypothetical protein
MIKEDIINMAHKAGGYTPKRYPDEWRMDVDDLERFAELVAAAEREACAKVCDEYDVAEDVNSSDTAEGIAIAIRARGRG